MRELTQSYFTTLYRLIHSYTHTNEMRSMIFLRLFSPIVNHHLRSSHFPHFTLLKWTTIYCLCVLCETHILYTDTILTLMCSECMYWLIFSCEQMCACECVLVLLHQSFSLFFFSLCLPVWSVRSIKRLSIHMCVCTFFSLRFLFLFWARCFQSVRVITVVLRKLIRLKSVYSNFTFV